ncbi:flavodoxin [delta proteobacterium NaphS2]|nr:flavodoxin [delta proteobacterium NaphS2]
MSCKILIVYHSQSGNTRKMAQYAADGARSMEGVEVSLKMAHEASLQDLLSCQGVIIASPEYFGYMAGMIKDFFDRTYDQARGKKEIFKKPYAVLISAGNDGTGALAHIERICLGYQFKKVLAPVTAKGPVENETLDQCRELGQTIAAGCREGIY